MEKAKLEKKIGFLESEKHAFNRSKSSSVFKLTEMTRTIESSQEMILRMKKDMKNLNGRLQKDKDGNNLNPVRLDKLQSTDPKIIGTKLNEINENTGTNGEYFKIGSLYDFNLLVKSETSLKEGLDLRENRFFIEGEGNIKYNYNNGHLASEPKLAALNFLNALERIPKLIEKYELEIAKILKDVPVLNEIINGTWRKEGELKVLKTEFMALDRKIQLSLKPIEQGDAKAEESDLKNDLQNNLQLRPANTHSFAV